MRQIYQSINQFICPEMQYTLDRTPREDATSANRCHTNSTKNANCWYMEYGHTIYVTD